MCSFGFGIQLTYLTACRLCCPDIMPGQGLYFSTLTNTWRARNCDTNSYGVSNKTYGLTPAPCRDCPTGQVATRAAPFTIPSRFFAAAGNDTGFTSVMACVNMPGGLWVWG